MVGIAGDGNGIKKLKVVEKKLFVARRTSNSDFGIKILFASSLDTAKKCVAVDERAQFPTLDDVSDEKILEDWSVQELNLDTDDGILVSDAHFCS